jgi:hypothetical protein
MPVRAQAPGLPTFERPAAEDASIKIFRSGNNPGPALVKKFLPKIDQYTRHLDNRSSDISKTSQAVHHEY